VSKLVRNDAGGNTDRSRDIVQVGAQLFDQGLLAAGARQQPTIGREGIERAEEAQALDEFTYKRVHRNHSFRLQLAEGHVNGPTIRTDIVKAIIGEVGAFADAHAGMAQQQEDVGRQIIAAKQLLLD
jgi:hypothetical protein